MAPLTPETLQARLGATYDDWATATLTEVTLIGERHIKKVTPVVTGTLRRSITSRVELASRGVIGTNLIYARPVNRRRKFMERGIENARSEIDDALKDAGAELWAEVTG